LAARIIIEVEPPGRAQRGVVNKFGNFAIFTAILRAQSGVRRRGLTTSESDIRSNALSNAFSQSEIDL